MDIHDKKFYNNETPTHTFYKYIKLRKIDTTPSKKELARLSVICDIKRIGTSLKLPKDIISRAENIFKKIIRELNPRTKKEYYWYAFVALLTAIREGGHKSPVTFQELRQAFENCGIHIPQRRINATLYEVSSKIGIKPGLRNPRDLVYRVVQDVLSATEVQERLTKQRINPSIYRQKLITYSLKLMNILEDTKHTPRPITKVAAIVYLADKYASSDLRTTPILTQRLASKCMKVSEVRIRDLSKIYRKIIQKKKIM